MTTLNLLGRTFGRFEIISELGRGGMGVVYRARQIDLDRIVALKVLLPELTHDESYVARFQQEARSAARLEHPNIVPIYEIGIEDGLHYLVMKYIQGRTLKQVMAAEGAMSVPRAATLIEPVAAALDYAHQHDVIHRDIKPSNIMVTDDGWIYLADFGLARGIDSSEGLTRTGTVMGTPEYMSPEQAQGLSHIGPPTDIYALGVVIYEMLTGQFPFEAETPLGMLAARLTQTPRPLRTLRSEFAPAVEAVVMRSLSRDPLERYNRATDMIAALRQSPLEHQPPAAVPLPPSPAARTDNPYATVAVAHQDSTMLEPEHSKPHSTDTPRDTPGSGATTPPPKPARRNRTLAIGLIVAGLLLALVGARQARHTPGGFGGRPTPTPLISTPIPHDSDVERALKQGWEFFNQDEYQAAFEQFDRAMQIEPDNIDAHLGQSYVYRFQEPPDYAAAIALLQRADNIDPDNPEILLELGWSFYERGFDETDLDDYAEAEEYFEETLDILESIDGDDIFIVEAMSDAYTGLGWSIYNQEDDYDDAEDAFEDATDLDPRNSNAFYGLGLTREALDDTEGAREAYETASRLEPEHKGAERRRKRLHYEE